VNFRWDQSGKLDVSSARDRVFPSFLLAPLGGVKEGLSIFNNGLISIIAGSEVINPLNLPVTMPQSPIMWFNCRMNTSAKLTVCG